MNIDKEQKEFIRMLRRDLVKKMMAEGKTKEEALAAFQEMWDAG